MILIPHEISRRINFLVGHSSQISNRPTRIFDEDRLKFLSDLSGALLADETGKTLPDVVTFAYWCRKSNLQRIRARHNTFKFLQMGLGLSIHVCPSNVPVNFAFSMAFGLLSGNTCMVRLPTRPSQTVDCILRAIILLFEKGFYDSIKSSLTIARFERDDEINQFWFAAADSRIIWGGDQTVSAMRKFACKPRSREIAFSDRYSLCALNPDEILDLSHSELVRFCNHLFNDIYIMDQAACSSPQLVLWVGSKKSAIAAQEKVWPIVTKIAGEKYPLSASQAMDKYVHLCQIAARNEMVGRITRTGNLLYRLSLTDLSAHQDECRGHFGTIHEYIVDDLSQIAQIVNERYQTLAVYGIQKKQVEELIVKCGLRGIDRVVAVGHTLDMDVIWDGYDVLSSLSRIIYT